MKWLKQNKLLFITLITAIYCSIVIICISSQEEHIDKACQFIKNNDNQNAIVEINKIWFIDEVGLNRETTLMAACESGNGQMIQLLLKEGADPNYKINGKLSALEFYCNFGYNAGVKPLKQLLDAGARQSIFEKKPAVFYLADRFVEMDKSEKEEATEMAILLLTNGAPLSYNGETLLHLAARADMAELFDQIIHTKNGIQLMNSKNKDGLTPWQVALNFGAVDVQQVIRGLESEYEEVKAEQEQETGDETLDELIEDGVVDIEQENEIVNDDDNSEQSLENDQEETKKGYYQELYGD